MRVAFVPRSAEIQPLFWRFVTFIPPPFRVTHIVIRKTQLNLTFSSKMEDGICYEMTSVLSGL